MNHGAVNFMLNNRSVKVEGNLRRRLLDVLREEFMLTGAKEGCGNGDCGSCMVLLDGEPVKSCLIQVNKVNNKSVVTIEGIGTPEHPHPIQHAFVAVGAVQCGFCTPGMVIAAKSLLDRNPRPTREQITEAFAGNLCRCTGYRKIIEAVNTAAAAMLGETPVLIKQPDSSRTVGKPFPQLGAWAKATGQAIYAADLSLPEMLHLKVLRSPYRHARIKSIDAAKAKNLKGVATVITAADIPGMLNIGIHIKDQPVLVKEEVRFKGEAIALAAAESVKVAQRALSLIEVDYEQLPDLKEPEDSLAEKALKIHPRGNILCETRIERGNIEQGLTEASVFIEADYETTYNEHAYMEPEAAVAYYDDEGRITVYVCCQNPFEFQAEVAGILGEPIERVRIIQALTGGGFGGKMNPQAAAFAGLVLQKTGRPAKIVFTRRESMETTEKRHPFKMRMKTGATSDGRLSAVDLKFTANVGAYASQSIAVVKRAATHCSGPYNVPHVSVKAKGVFTHNVPCAAMRGFGSPQIAFAVESQMDLLAAKLGIDPWEIRMRNAFDENSTTPTGQTLSHVGIKQTLEALHEEYVAAKERREVFNSAHRKKRRGVGLASIWYGIGRVGAGQHSEVKISLLPSGKFRLLVGAADMGQGTWTTMVQIAAEELEVSVEDMELVTPDTAVTPFAPASNASQQTTATGNATLFAARTLREKIAHVKDLFPKVTNRQEVYNAAQSKGIELDALGVFHPVCISLDDLGRGAPYINHCYMTHLAEVEVDRAKNKVKVLRLTAAHDVGRVINRLGVEGQIDGGIMMGLGFALSEKFDPERTSSLKNYGIPTIRELPETRIIILEIPGDMGPLGSKGMGEGAIIPCGPAIVNAVADATGIRPYKLPLNMNG